MVSVVSRVYQGMVESVVRWSISWHGGECGQLGYITAWW